MAQVIPGVSYLTLDKQARAGFKWLTLLTADSMLGKRGDVWRYHRSHGSAQSFAQGTAVEVISLDEALDRVASKAA